VGSARGSIVADDPCAIDEAHDGREASEARDERDSAGVQSAAVRQEGGTMRYTATAALLCWLLQPVSAQLQSSSPAFDAVSIRPRVGDAQSPPSSPSRFANGDATLAFLISYAFNVKEFQIIGGPSWIRSDGFEVLATTVKPASDDLMRLMMQRLLADRFGLIVHREMITRDIYGLRVTKGGSPRLKQSTTDCVVERPADAAPFPSDAGTSRPCSRRLGMGGARATLVMERMPLSQLADLLERFVNRLVIDETNLRGVYDVSLTFAADQVTWRLPLDAQTGRPISGDEVSLDTALREQLGLQLVSTRGTVPVVVIDRAHRPDPN